MAQKSSIRKWSASRREPLVSFIQERWNEAISKKEIRRLLESNCCKINGRFERFGSSWVEKGDLVEFFSSKRSASSFTTLFENKHCLVVDKPSGWICDPANCKKTFSPSLFLCHRLDKDTTGVLLLAKGELAKQKLQRLFADRKVEKEYWALVDGVPRLSEGVIENFLAKKRLFEGQTIWGSSPQGDFARTEWRLLQAGDEASLILCRPHTGRTHQIRVHMAEMGHPLLIDRQYGASYRSRLFAPRPMLHAHRLAFSLEGDTIDVQAPLPEDFSEILGKARISFL